MASILDQIAASKAKRELEAKFRPDNQQIKPGGINLTGTGLNKKFLTKVQSQINRDEKAAIVADEAKIAGLQADAALANAVDETTAAMEKEYHRGEDITLDDSQEAALSGMLDNQYCVLIGAAGTGKTTITKRYMQRLMKIIKPTDIAIAAFTGRASQQIRRVLPQELQANCSTIHALLEYAPTEEEYEYEDPITKKMEHGVRKIFRPQRNASFKLTQKIFIFDESGMFGITLWNEFIQACPTDARIVLIGDIHQLPPVMDKSILGFAMNNWPVFELKKIHRQAAGNAIIDNAHRILNGELVRNAPNFHLIGTGVNGSPEAPGGSNGMQIAALKWLRHLADKGLFDPYRDAFIVPQNKGMLGQIELNPHLMMMFNPPKTVNGVVVNKRFDIHTGTDRATMAIGDKVMCTSNINTVNPPITNGMIGVVESINLNGRYNQKLSQYAENTSDAIDFGDLDAANFADTLDDLEDLEEETDKPASRDQRQASHVMTVKFENGQTLSCSTAGDYRRIIHSYAITCHKAQGGEYPNVVILCHSANAVMLFQEWLYTGVTRARDNVYIFCNNRGLKLATERQRIKGKTLQEKIKAYNIVAETDKVEKSKQPVLWKARKVLAEV